MAKTRNWQEVRDTPVNYVDSCERLSHKELERRGDADVRGIVGQAWWPKPIAH